MKEKNIGLVSTPTGDSTAPPLPPQTWIVGLTIYETPFSCIRIYMTYSDDCYEFFLSFIFFLTLFQNSVALSNHFIHFHPILAYSLLFLYNGHFS